MTTALSASGSVTVARRLALLASVVALGLAVLLLTGSAADAAAMAGTEATPELMRASGGVSDSQLAVSIVLPIIFVSIMLMVVMWALARRVKPGEDYHEPGGLQWWRTGAWYGRQDEDSAEE
ncbi:MAG TPA: hypothetical protein QGF05_02820 [Dehalococcoidia bacterium]|nr:hypothetical protein [Dehalococcoidia bacterium]